ncbi:MAG: kinase/pyrophosphorylase [Candidatus Methylomirabilis sp.]
MRRVDRIEVIEYAVKHDDGQDPFGLDRADIVLVGVSRTSKTPLSLYLAEKGWQVANVPVILNLPLPGPLMKIDQGRIVGLILREEHLVEVRRARLEHPDAPLNGAYADLEHVRFELRYSRSLFRKSGWPVIDMSNRSIEEAAAEVLALVAPHGAAAPDAEKQLGARRGKGAKGARARRASKTL